METLELAPKKLGKIDGWAILVLSPGEPVREIGWVGGTLKEAKREIAKAIARPEESCTGS